MSVDVENDVVSEERLDEFMGAMVGHLVGATTIACTILMIEPFAFDTGTENHAALGGLMYGASAFICTPCSLSQDVGRGMGAQSGEAGMSAVFNEAGYSSFRRAAETPFNIVYEAKA